MTDTIPVPRELLEELREAAEDAADCQIAMRIPKGSVVWKDYGQMLERTATLLLKQHTDNDGAPLPGGGVT